ncbi:MAG: hypothetical protein AAFO69_13140, partial [Bacteroidota bacterium]
VLQTKISPTEKRVEEIQIHSIKRSIIRSMQGSSNEQDDFYHSLTVPGIYRWEKDLYSRYTFVDENYAHAAGFDSPKSMLGKNDFAMPWRSLAPMFQAGDWDLVRSPEATRTHVFEKEIMYDRIADILVFETTIYDRSSRLIGVGGYFIDISNDPRWKISNQFSYSEQELNLGTEFGNESLYEEEITFFKLLVRNTSLAQIAQAMSITVQKVKAIRESVRVKLQCTNPDEIIVAAVRSGLPLLLFQNKK